MAKVQVHGSAGVTSINGQTGIVIVDGRNLFPNSALERVFTRFMEVPVRAVLAEHVNDTVAISFDAKLNSGDPSHYIQVYGYQNSGISIDAPGYFFTPESEYKRYSFVRKVKDYGQQPGLSPGAIAFYDSAGVNSYTIKNIKIELGNISTGWAPAPEDILARLAVVEEKLGIISDPPMIDGPEMEELIHEAEKEDTTYDSSRESDLDSQGGTGLPGEAEQQ